MKSVKMFGKSVPLLAIVVISVLAIGAGAALLTQYGYVEMSAEVEQSIKIDGNVFSTPATDNLGMVIGGSCYLFPHYADNIGEKDAVITYSHTGNPAAEVDVLLLGEIHEAVEVYDVLYKDPIPNAGPGFEVTKTWEGGNVIWVITLEPLVGEDYSHTEFGLVFGSSATEATFHISTGQMHGTDSPPIIKEWTGTTWTDTMPLYDGIIVNNPGGTGEPGYGDTVFVIKVPAKYLGGCGSVYYWSVTVAANWPSGYGFTQYPDSNVWARWSGAGLYLENRVGIPLPNPFDLAAGEHLDFHICYDFTNEAYELYDIDTFFNP